MFNQIQAFFLFFFVLFCFCFFFWQKNPDDPNSLSDACIQDARQKCAEHLLELLAQYEMAPSTDCFLLQFLQDADFLEFVSDDSNEPLSAQGLLRRHPPDGHGARLSFKDYCIRLKNMTGSPSQVIAGEPALIPVLQYLFPSNIGTVHLFVDNQPVVQDDVLIACPQDQGFIYSPASDQELTPVAAPVVRLFFNTPMKIFCGLVPRPVDATGSHVTQTAATADPDLYSGQTFADLSQCLEYLKIHANATGAQIAIKSSQWVAAGQEQQIAPPKLRAEFNMTSSKQYCEFLEIRCRCSGKAVVAEASARSSTRATTSVKTDCPFHININFRKGEHCFAIGTKCILQHNHELLTPASPFFQARLTTQMKEFVAEQVRFQVNSDAIAAMLSAVRLKDDSVFGFGSGGVVVG